MCFSGLPEGVVFDSGDGVSHSVPVFDGHYLPHAIQRFPLAGVDVTMHLIKVFVPSHPAVYWNCMTINRLMIDCARRFCRNRECACAPPQRWRSCAR